MKPLLHLGAALLLGLPTGFAFYVMQEAIRRPTFGWLLWHHPWLTIPAILGAGSLGALAALAGYDPLRDSLALHGWIVVAACVIYLLVDRPPRARR